MNTEQKIGTFIDLRLNFAFSLVFGSRGNEDLLLKLVNAILPELEVNAVTLINQYQPGRRKKARSAVFDVACTTSHGKMIIIEMQYRRQDDFNDRMVFYSTFPIQNSLHIGEDSYRFTPTYIVGITDFVIKGIESNSRIVNKYTSINEEDSTIRLSENLHYVTVELSKLKKKLSEIVSPAELLFFAIRNIWKMKEMPPKYLGSGLEKMFEICKFAAMKGFAQKEYIQAFMADLDLRSQRRTAREEGREEGRAQSAKEIALSLKTQGIPADVIATATGLTAEQIEAL